ncbi:S8 family serine peptidase [Paenibacillus lignilyticus]|uniref:S8 family serine peptidase n=1 Tax=Paenibacillus lignilyticus TaxID=1172615 RepID=A0ABS5CAS9_9BACL|nr:S8 family serine peptidase [Paenibacillus lignilyticus]
MKRSFLKKSLSLATVSVLAGSLVTTGLPAAHAAPLDKAFITKEGLEAVTRLLQQAKPEAGINAIPGEAYIADDIDTASAKEMNVILQLSGQPAAVGIYAAKLGYKALAAEASEVTVQSEQQAFVRSAQASSIPFKINRSFNTVLNGMEITIRADLIPQLAKLPGVKAIHKNVIYYPIDEPDGYQIAAGSSDFDPVPLEQIGVLKAWDRGLTGKGLKVGVIDTGIDYLHPDLKGNYVEGGYDAINQDDDPYEDLPEEGYEDSTGSIHGTHVSGTIAGTASNPTSVHVQKGVAYEADLYAYKVLGPEGGTSSQVIDGIEHAVDDHMDVINLSLGSDLEKDPDSPDSIAVNNAVLAGVVAVVANGNAGGGNQYYYSMGSPAASQMAISVGAVTSDSNRVQGTIHSAVGSEVYDTNMSLMSWTTDKESFNTMFGTNPIQGVYVGLGREDDYKGLKPEFLADKIVFISRGLSSFDEKVKLAAKHGAKAAVIFNGNYSASDPNVPDLSEEILSRDGAIGPLAFLGDGYDYIPTFDMPGKMGRALARQLKAHPDQKLQFTMKNDFKTVVVAGDRMADFSSRGPNSDGNYGIKPDLSAPGVSIFSSIPAYGQANPDANYDKAYAKLSGTSMATPHVAGLALLIKQAHPDWTPTDIRAALANTAEEIQDENGTMYDVYSQGAGRVNVMNAIDTRAIIESMDEITLHDDKMNPIVMPSEGSSVSFGMMNPGASEAVKKPLRVKNLSNVSVTYKAKIVMHPSVTSDPHHPIPTPNPSEIIMGLEGLTSNQITVGAGDEFNFNLTAKSIPRAKVGVYEGEVLLESNGLPSLHLPFVIHIGDESDDNDFLIQNLTLSNTTVSKDAPIDITASLPTGTINHFYAVIVDLDNEVLGLLAEIYDRDESKDFLKPIPSNIIIPEFDGSYNLGILVQDGNKLNEDLPEGRYKLAVVGTVYDKNYNVLDESVAFKSFYVTNEAAVDEPNPPTNPPYTGGPITAPNDEAYNKDVAASVIEKGQTGITIAPQSKLEGTQLSVSVTDADLQKAIAEVKPSVALTIGAASKDASSAELKLTAAQAKLVTESGLKGTIVFTWNDASVALPIPALSQGSDGSDIVLTIKKDEGSKSEFTKQVKDATILGTPYVFEASSLKNGVASPLKLKADQAVTRSFLVENGVSTAGALYLDGDHVYPVPAKVTAAGEGKSIVTIRRPGFSTYAAASRHVTFSDIDKSWARDQIQTLADKFLLNGTSEHAYSPKANVTRAQFASMLARTLGLQSKAAVNPFSDVRGSDWFASDVTSAYEAGLVTGSDGRFNPNAAITRQDLTVMLARAIKLVGLQQSSQPGNQAYADAALFSGYAQESIQMVTDAGLMKGVESKGKFYFQPAGATTREAAAKVLYELLLASGRI